MAKNKTGTWDLIAGKIHNELDENESEEFSELIREDENLNLFEKAKKINSSLNQSHLLKDSGKRASWSFVQQTIKRQKLRLYTIRFVRYAAIIVMAFILGTYFKGQYNQFIDENKYAEIEVQNGQTGHLFLFDGTEVWLNSGTKIRYPNTFDHTERSIELNGEAFFKVAHNKKLPFKVKTKKLEVEVLGTSFNVSAYDDETNQSVVLEEGKVQLNNVDGRKITEMIPGQMAVLDQHHKMQINKVDASFYTSWKEGKVSFNGERMEDIARKLERWYNVEISFENEALKDHRLTGTILRNKPIDQTIMAFELLTPMRFIYRAMASDKDRIIIKNK